MNKTHTINAKTAKGQATQMLRALKKEAKRVYGWTDEQCDFEMFVARADEHHGMSKGTWTVCWESGPFEWGVTTGLGGNMWGEEMGYPLHDRRLKPTFEFADGIFYEHYWSFDYVFYPDRD